MKVRIPGYTTLTGQPEAILRLMQDARMMDNAGGDDLIHEIEETAMRAFGITLRTTGDTYAERAESLIREMDKANMLTIEEEE